jgi:hypothetical protein
MIKIDFTPCAEREADLRLLCLAFGHTDDPITAQLMLPHGQMAQDAFEQAVDAAFERLTPKQQAALLQGVFQLKLGHRLRVADPASESFSDEWHVTNTHLL